MGGWGVPDGMLHIADVHSALRGEEVCPLEVKFMILMSLVAEVLIVD